MRRACLHKDELGNKAKVTAAVIVGPVGDAEGTTSNRKQTGSSPPLETWVFRPRMPASGLRGHTASIRLVRRGRDTGVASGSLV